MSESAPGRLEQLVKKLRDPMRLRIAVALVALAAGYFCVYVPLGGRIEAARKKLKHEQERRDLADEVEFLRAQSGAFVDRLPENSDVNEWVQYLIAAIRKRPVTLINLEPTGEKRLGPYRGVAFLLEVRGETAALNELLYWLESDERMFRVETIRVQPARKGPKQRIMRLSLLGLES